MLYYTHKEQTRQATGREGKKMKYSNVKFTAIATYSDGTTSKLRAFATEKALSNWANKQYEKDEGTTVTVWEGYSDTVYCIYHA